MEAGSSSASLVELQLQPQKSSTSSMIDLKRGLRKERLQLLHRFKSIAVDAKFVENVSFKCFKGVPVLPNLRNGLWYCNPSRFQVKSKPAYFKSGDGHAGQVAFHLSRANLHVLDTALERRSNEPSLALPENCIGGVLLVDSTRFGKIHPDSFTRTVPFWCAVVNTAIAKVRGEDITFQALFPPWILGEREAQDLESEVNNAADSLLFRGSRIYELAARDLPPLKAVWVNPLASHVAEREEGADPVDVPRPLQITIADEDSEAAFTPIICLSASVAFVSDSVNRQFRSWSYVQGAGDDEESWCNGLTPAEFWDNFDKFLDCERNESCVVLIRKIVENRQSLMPLTYVVCQTKSLEFRIAAKLGGELCSLPTVVLEAKTALRSTVTGRMLSLRSKLPKGKFWSFSALDTLVSFFAHNVNYDKSSAFMLVAADVELAHAALCLLLMVS